MTLKEKVGQMTQLEVGMITDGSEGSLRINPEKLRKAVVDYGVGSILNVKDIALPPAKWHEIIGAIARSDRSDAAPKFRSSTASTPFTARTTCRRDESFRSRSAWRPPGTSS